MLIKYLIILVIFVKYKTLLDIMHFSNYRGSVYGYNPSITLSGLVQTNQNNFQTSKKYKYIIVNTYSHPIIHPQLTDFNQNCILL